MLSKITLAGADETTDIKSLVALCKNFKLSEIAIHVSEKNATFNTDAYWWLREFFLLDLYGKDCCVALHINDIWAENFSNGDISPELETFLSMQYHDETPFIKRVQLNFQTFSKSKLQTLVNVIQRFPDIRFVFSYNEASKEFIQKLYATGATFDCLFNASFGKGILPEKRPSPMIDTIYHGYAGGLSPENVTSELDKIKQQLTPTASFYIDAKSNLQDDDGHFSIDKSILFLKKATTWAHQNSVATI